MNSRHKGKVLMVASIGALHTQTFETPPANGERVEIEHKLKPSFTKNTNLNRHQRRAAKKGEFPY